MVDKHLVDLATQHPGGWRDIIDYVNEHYDRYQATYKIVDASVTKVMRAYDKAQTESGAKADYIYRSNVTEQNLPRLENISHPMSGMVACLGWTVLKNLGLPLPGSKEWLKPCSQWRINEKG